MAPNFPAPSDRLKQPAMVRSLGVPSHTPELETGLNAAVDSGRFHVVMVAYNFNNWPDLDNILAKAHEHGVGFVAMKTLKGAYHTVLADFTPTERLSFTQAAFKWVFSNEKVSGLVVSMSKVSQLDEYLYASGKKLESGDLALLDRYDELVARQYCRPGCGECLDACPAGLPIDDVLRYSMYYEGYGSERVAMAKYQRLDASRRASVCADCSAPCQSACPFELPIRDRMSKAHRLLASA
jgi:predicted aldo/keto reductase-like oxidoreductase